MIEEDFSVTGKIILAGCRGCEGRVAVEEAGELGYQVFSLKRKCETKFLSLQ